MKQLFLCLILVFPILGAIADGEYVFILRARGNPYWNTLKDGIENTAHHRGIAATVYQTESEKDAEEQLNLCQTALVRKPKFLAIAAANMSVGIQCFKMAVKQGVLVADIDRQIVLDEADRQGARAAFSVGSDNLLIGREAARYLSTLNVPRTARILILEGAAGAIAGIQRVQGFKEELRAILPDAVIVASVAADWDRLKAMNTTSNILSRTPDLDVIYTANDMMALGAVEALRTAGRRNVKVIGVDGTEAARSSVAKGDMSATVAQLPYYIGTQVVELGIQAVHGKEVPRLVSVDTPVLTREKLADKTFEFHQHLR